MNDNVEEIKKRLDIVDFISGYLTLKKAGVNYKASCPFHSEKTPSFMVSAERQIYKCFGCGESGDIFSFLMKMEGLNFPEAIEMLANRAGVIIDKHINKEVYQKEKDNKSRLYKINKLAAQVYHKILLEHSSASQARDYLKKRKLSTETINVFNIGYAPTKPILEQFLHDRGFSYEEIHSAGNPDRFKNRIIFPITDQMGNVLGFTGRVINPADQPKYLNTPETNIFHKGRILYGLDIAKQSIKQDKNAVIVEGQMDVISSHQAGVKNVVASSGTALTSDHLDVLSRYSNNIIFAFDQDLAGEQAAKKSIMMAISKGLNAKTIIIPKGFKDAGEIVEKDPKLWQKTIIDSVHVLDWIIQRTFIDKKDNLSGQEKKEIAQNIIPFISIIPDQIEQEHYIKILTSKLDTKEGLIIDAINKINKTSVKKDKVVNRNTLSPGENLVGLLLAYPNLITEVINKLDYKEFSDQKLAQIYKLLQSCYTKDSCPAISGDNMTKKCDNSHAIIKCFQTKLSKDVSAKLDYLLFEIQTAYQDFSSEDVVIELNKNITRIKSIFREDIKDHFAKAIKQAENQGDIKKVKELLKEFQNALK